MTVEGRIPGGNPVSGDGQLAHLGLTLNHGEVLEVCREVPAGALLGDACLLQGCQQLLDGRQVCLPGRPDALHMHQQWA